MRRGRNAGLWGVIALSVVGGGRAQESTKQWGFSVGNSGSVITLSSPALSPDGSTVYVGTIEGSIGRLVAVPQEGGSLKWQLPFPGFIETSPAVAPDGTIYFGCGNGRLYSVRDGGRNTASVNWSLDLHGYLTSSPAIGADGTIYVGSADGQLHAVTPGGQERWAFPTGGIIESSPAIGVDGTLYFGSHDRSLYAVRPDGQLKWQFVTGGLIFASPAIGADGTIYVGSRDQRLYAIAPDSTKKWDFLTNGDIQGSPAIGADGTIYFPADRSLYALRPEIGAERLRWKKDIGTGSTSSPAVRADGTIIFGADDGMVHALEPDGRKRWDFDTRTGEGNDIESSPLIAPDGSIYIGSLDGHLYKINGNGSPLSEYSSWPAFRRDVRHTGRAAATNNGGLLANIATRARAGGGNNLIAGFIVQGAIPKAYLVRAIGPALGKPPFNVTGFMPDPRMQIYSGNVFFRANDNWGDSDNALGFGVADTADGVGAFPLSVGSKDAAVVPILAAGAYTVLVQGVDASEGVALVEVYDATGDATGRVLNLSTRGKVGIGEEILIAGVVVKGGGSRRLLLRGIGPGLTQFGVPGVLAQPRLELFRGSTSMGSNAGWSGTRQADLAAAAAAVSAFPLAAGSADCALLFDAAPGDYTIQISGLGGTTGEAMVEVYVLP